MSMTGLVHQVNVSNGGVPKSAVSATDVTFAGLCGDRQRNRKLHGGRDQAVCLYSLELIEALRAEGHHIAPGSVGENLTIAGLVWDRLAPGDRLRVGAQVRLELMSYTVPCRVIARCFAEQRYGRIGQDRHPGWSRFYARVLSEGLVQPGDAVSVEARFCSTSMGEI